MSLLALSYWHWFALAAILMTLDVVLGANFVLLWCGFAAGLTGVLLWIIPVMSWEWQGLIFGLGVVASIFLWRKVLKKQVLNTDKPYLNQRSRQYIDREFTLEEPIINGRGRVKVDDTIWRVDGEDLPAGTRIRVIGVDGIVLKVKKS